MSSPHLLAALAARLNREAGQPALPALFFLTGPERTPDPVAIAQHLPRGTAVVYRHFGAADRVRVARRLATICRARELTLLIAADPDLAQSVDAGGVHWPEARLKTRGWGRLVTAAAHSGAAARHAAACGVDACVLAPIFPTNSSSGNEALGLFRASQIAQQCAVPVIALGGINARNATRLSGRGFAGVAAVDAFA